MDLYMTKRKKIILRLVGAFFLFGVLGSGYLFYGYQIEDYLHRKAFEARVWKDRLAIEKSPYPRLRMVDDLLGKQNFLGRTRQDVTDLLGEPDKTDYFKEYDLTYWLGPERGFFRIDSEWLVLKVNSEEKVTECRIVSD
jgi:hypothetical protein